MDDVKKDSIKSMVRDLYQFENPEKAKRLTETVLDNIIDTYDGDFKKILENFYENENPEKAQRLNDSVFSNIAQKYKLDVDGGTQDKQSELGFDTDKFTKSFISKHDVIRPEMDIKRKAEIVEQSVKQGEIPINKKPEEELKNKIDPKEQQVFDIATENVDKWYKERGGLTPQNKIKEFETKIKDVTAKYEKYVLSAESKEDLSAINDEFKNEVNVISNELGLEITEDGSVKPYDDEIDRYVELLGREIRLNSKGEKDSYIGDVMDRLAAGTHSFTANMVDLAGFLTGANYFEGYKNLSEGQRFRAEQFRKQSQRYDGTIQELAENGNYGEAAGLAIMSAVESLPMMLPMFANPTYGVYVMGAGAAMEKYREIENKDVPKWQKILDAVASGANEAIWEKAITVPILAKSKQAMLSMGRKRGKEIIKEAVDASLKNSAYKAGGSIPSWVAEGLSEVATGISNDIADKIYLDSETQIGSHAFDDMVVGAIMGKAFSAPSDIATYITKKEYRDVAKKALKLIPKDISYDNYMDLAEILTEREILTKIENDLAPEFKGKYLAKIDELNKKAQNIIGKVEGNRLVVGKAEEGDTEVQQAQLDYLKQRGVEVPEGTKMDELGKLYDVEVAKETAEVEIDEAETPEQIEEIKGKIEEDVDLLKKLDAKKEFITEKEKLDESLDKEEISETEYENKLEEITDTYEGEIAEKVEPVKPKVEVKETEAELQKKETVKPETEKKLAEKKTEISEIQPTETEQVEEKLQKKETVKEKVEEKLTDREGKKITWGEYVEKYEPYLKSVNDFYNIRETKATLGLGRQGRKPYKSVIVSEIIGSFQKEFPNRKTADEWIKSEGKNRYEIELNKRKESVKKESGELLKEQIKEEKLPETVTPEYEKLTANLGIKGKTLTKSLGESARNGKIGGVSVILQQGTKENEVILESIKTPKYQRGTGKATNAMNKIIAEADKQGLTIKLRAVPEKGADISQENLIKFYQDFGFEFKEGSIEGVRKPKKKGVQDATKIGTPTQEAGKQTQELEPREEGRIRLRDNEKKSRLEAEKGEKAKEIAEKPKKNIKFVKKEGYEISESIPQGERRAQDEEGKRMAQESDSRIRGIETAIRNTQKDREGLPEQEQQERITRAIENYAKENNLWIPIDKTPELGTPIRSGNENEVYYNESDGFVYKVNNLFNTGDIPGLLEQIKIHNEIFPETKYELIGFTGFDGGNVYPVLKQPYIDSETYATPKEIQDYMENLGFEEIGEGEFSNGKYEVVDLRPRNVLKDIDGNLYIVDNIIEKIEQTFKAEKPTPQQREEAAKAKIAEGFSNLAETIGAKKTLTGEERETAIQAITRIIEGLIELGIAKGMSLKDAVRDYLKQRDYIVDEDLLDEAIRRREKAEDDFPIGTTNAKVRTSREMRGLEAIPKEERIGNEELWGKVVDKIDKGEIFPRQVVREIVISDDVETSAMKEAIVKHDRWRILKETKYTNEEIIKKQNSQNKKGLIELFQRRVELENEMQENDLAAEKLGATWGRAGQFRQRNVEEDLSFEAIKREAKILNGGKELTIKQEQKFKELSEKYEKLQKEYDKIREKERIREQQFQAEEEKKRKEAEQKLLNDIRNKVTPKSAKDFDTQFKSDFKRQKLSQKENDIKERLKERLSRLANVKFAVGEEGASLIVEEISGVIQDMSELGIIKLEQGIDKIISKVKDYLRSVNKDFDVKNLDKYKDKIKNKLGIPEIENTEYDELINKLVDKSQLGFDISVKGILKKLLYNRVVAGSETIDDVVDDIYESVKDRIPNIDKRMIRDALSGYGEFRRLSKEEIDIKIRELKRQGRLDSAIEDVEDNRLPLRSGVERDKTTQETREKQARIIKEIKDRDLVPPPTQQDQETQWRNGLQAYQRRLENAIEDVKKEIETGERKQKAKFKKYDTPELESLREELSRLKEIRNAIDKETGRYAEHRESAIIKATERVIAEIEMDIDKLRRGVPIDKNVIAKRQGLFGLSKPMQEKFTSERIEELGKLKDALQQQLSELLPDAIKDKALLDKYKKQRQRRLEQLLEQQRTKDYGVKPKPYRPALDKEAIMINRDIEKLKYAIEKEKEQIRYKNMNLAERIGEGFINAWNIPKALMASIDLSAPMRQGIVMISKPKIFMKAFNGMFKYAFSEKIYEDWLFTLKTTDDYYEMIANDLYIAEPTAKLAAKEEDFMSNWLKYIDKIPLYGAVRVASERAYVGFLNKLRVDTYLNFKDKLQKQGFEGEELQNELKSYSHFINTATGRGKLKMTIGNKEVLNMEPIAALLNSAFFSPRLIASRLAMFNPAYYASMTKEARKDAVKTYLGTVGIIMSTLALSAIAFSGDDKFEIELDPRSSDFLKIRYGKIRYDLWGGHQQVARTLTQFITGKIKTDGEVKAMTGDKWYGQTRLKTLMRFFENKLSPSTALAKDLLQGGKNYEGEDITITNELINKTVPLYLKDVKEAVEEEGWEFAFIAGFPALFGVGVQTYKDREVDVNETEETEETERVIRGGY